MLDRLVGKPLLFDKLNAALPAKISAWIAEDTKKAQKRKRDAAEKKARRAAKKKRG